MKLPKTLYCKVEGSDDDPFLLADSQIKPLVEDDEKTVIGIYNLVSTETWTTTATKVVSKI